VPTENQLFLSDTLVFVACQFSPSTAHDLTVRGCGGVDTVPELLLTFLHATRVGFREPSGRSARAHGVALPNSQWPKSQPGVCEECRMRIWTERLF